MTILYAVLVLLAIVGFGVTAVVYTRWRGRRGDLVRFPELAAERPNDLNFGFAIILGFVLVAALQNYQGAQQAAVTEGRALTTMSRSALGIPAQLRDDLSHQLVCYGRDVIEYDWATNDSESVGLTAGGSPFADASGDRISQTLARISTTDGVKDAVMGSLIEGETALREARAQRLDMGTHLPVLFWAMVVVGAMLVIALSAVLMAQEFAWLQTFVVCGSAVIIAFTVILIGSLDRPYSGEWPLPVVQPTAMTRAVASNSHFALDPRVDGSCP